MKCLCGFDTLADAETREFKELTVTGHLDTCGLTGSYKLLICPECGTVKVDPESLD